MSAKEVAHIPQRFLKENKLVYFSWFNLTQSLQLVIGIDDDNFLYEMKRKEILGSCNIKPSDSQSGNNGSIINGNIYNAALSFLKII